MFKFKKGQKAKDIITGFTGIITARADYITGCNQYSLASEAQDNKPADYQWFDENRVEIVEETDILKRIEGEPVKGGPQNHPSKG